VTTLWEINGDLLTTNQPSGRVVTVPNSVVLSSNVVNFDGSGSPHVWSEAGIRVAYETDLDFARSVIAEEATAMLGEEMAAESKQIVGRGDRSKRSVLDRQVHYF